MKKIYKGKITSFKNTEYVSNTGELCSGIAGEITLDNSDETIPFDNRGCRKGEYVSKDDIVEFEIAENESGKYARDIIVVVPKIYQGKIISARHVKGFSKHGNSFENYKGEIVSDSFDEFISFDGRGFRYKKMAPKENDVVEFKIKQSAKGKQAHDMIIISTESTVQNDDKLAKSNKDNPHYFKSFQELYEIGEYERILRTNDNPNFLLELFLQTPQLVLNSLAKYLGDNIENVRLNEFQKQLIYAKIPQDLHKLKNSDWSFKQFSDTAVVGITEEEYKRINTNVTVKTSLENIVSRFWIFKNKLSFYLCVLWIISSRNSNTQQKKCLSYFPEIASKENDYFVDKYPQWIKICEAFIFSAQNTDPKSKKSFYRKLIGGCLDYKKTDVLFEILDLSCSYGYEEAKYLKAIFENSHPNYEDLCDIFDKKELGDSSEIYVNIINYLWSENKGNSNPFINLLIYLFQKSKEITLEYETAIEYITIIKGIISIDKYSNFNHQDKEAILNKYLSENNCNSGTIDALQNLISNNANGTSSTSFEKILNSIVEIKNDSLENDEKEEKIRIKICEYFALYGSFSPENNYDIFSYLPFSVIEDLLLKKYKCNDYKDTQTTFALLHLYFSRNEMLKVAYIYTASKKQREKNFLFDLSEIADCFRESYNLYNIDKSTNVEIIKIAIKVLSSEEFDAFIEWAKKIKINQTQYDKDSTRVKIFDINIKKMLADDFYDWKSAYDKSWKQLFKCTLNEKNETQDSLRFSIIASFFTRYGEGSYIETINELIDESDTKKEFQDYYSCLWKGLTSGKYSSNFISLNKELLENAPLTYWNIFYDYAVCKNHVFSSDSFEGEQWHKPDCDMQEFYDLLLKRYVHERESVFLKIAAVLLEECDEVINPNFDQYLTYCQSIKNKDFILRMIIRLLIKNRHTDDLKHLLNSGVWNCSKQENTMLQTLLSFVADKEQGLSSYAYLPKDKYYSFKNDILDIFKNFPDISDVYDIVGEIKPTPYYYTLFNNIFEICFDNNIFKTVMSNGLALPDNLNYENIDTTLSSYLEMIITVYKKQLQNPIEKGSNQHTIYVQNRYHRILASKLLLGKELEADIENSIYELILSNGHEKSIKKNFNNFKNALNNFMFCLGKKNVLSRWVLKGIITNNWSEFCHNIEKYSEEALKNLGEILKYTRFQELNKSLLLLFINKTNSGFEFKLDVELQKKVKCCSCLVGEVIETLSENDGSKIEHIANICQLDTLTEAIARKSVQTLNELLNKIEYSSTDITQKDLDIQLYTSALRSAVYDQTIVFSFRKILLSKDRNISPLWANVFGLMNCSDLYFYNLAVMKSASKKINEAKTDLEEFKKWQTVYEMQKNSKVMFPEEWEPELLSLKNSFDDSKHIFRPLREKEMNLIFSEKNSEGIDLLRKYIPNNKKTDSNSALESLVVFADKSLPLSEKLEDCVALLNYITGPDSFYGLLKKSKDSIENISYNEFLIISSSILITSSKNCSGSDKLEILFAMFEVFENLQEKDRIKDYNDKIKKEAVAYLFAPNNLFFDAWINNYGTKNERDIEKILESCSDKNSISSLSQLVKSCQQLLKNCSSEMQKLNCLRNWRQSNRIPEEASDYEKSFELAVESKINELSLLPALKLTISSDMIEDGKIYYLLENHDTSKACIFLDNENTQVQAVIRSKELSYRGVFNNPIGILRPGYACGQYFELPKVVTKNIAEQKIEVIINIIVDGKLICNNTEGIREFKTHINIFNNDMNFVGENKYMYNTPAFSSELPGFGREDEKKKIKQTLIDSNKNLLVLYGPSRAGKSSLLNYIRNDLIEKSVVEDSSVIHVSIANQFNDDYQKNMIDASPLVDFSTPEQIMDYLFVSPLKIAFTDPENSRCKKIGQKDLSKSTQNTIKNILCSNEAVLEKIQKVGKCLSEERHQVWLIFDEFQQVIEKWSDISKELEALCGTIATYTDCIKLILCGSDELVRLFECDDMVQWKNFRATISDEYTYLVEQLNEKDFCEMMKDPNIWGNTSAFSEDALKLLHKYTGGNAISGKIIGNEILKELRAGDYSNRSRIYPSDITRVAYKLLDEKESGSITTKLTDNTAKNLDDDAQNYLLYIAYTLNKEPSRLSVSFREIKNFFRKKTAKEIESSIKLLCARGLIKACGEKEYSFSTMFYFDFFNSKAYEDKIDELKELYSSEEESASLERIQDHVVSFCNASDSSKAAGLLTGIIGQLKDESIKESIRNTIGGTRNDYSTHIGGNFIQNNIQINAQTINSAFTTLLTPNIDSDSFLAAFESLPKLTSYMNEVQKSQVNQITKELSEYYSEYDNCFDSDGICINDAQRYETETKIIQTETQLENLNAPAEKKLISDTIGAIVNSDDFMTLSEQRWEELLCLNDKSIVAKLKSLPSEFEAPLTFAVVLHNVFDNLHRTMETQKNSQMNFTQELDYCPVAIMYCKIVEAMLKKGHTPMYIRNLGEKTLKLGGKTTFADLGTPEKFDSKNKDLSIGSFTSHIVYLPKWKISLDPQRKPKKDDFCFKRVVENETVNYTDNICKLIANEDPEEILPIWKGHARALEVIRVIRNRSAHDAMSITKENIDWLIEILFKQGELLKIWDLSEKKTF